MGQIQRVWKLYNTKNIRYGNLVPATFQLMQVLLTLLIVTDINF